MTWKMMLPLEIKKIGRDISKWKNDKFLATIANSKCQKIFKWRSQEAVGSTNLKVRARKGHLSYFHIAEIVEIIVVMGIA